MSACAVPWRRTSPDRRNHVYTRYYLLLREIRIAATRRGNGTAYGSLPVSLPFFFEIAFEIAFGVSIVCDYHRLVVNEEEEEVRRNGRPSKESQLKLSLSLSSTSRVCPLSRGRAIGIPRVSTRRPDIVGWRDLERERRSIAFSRVTRPLEAC